MNKLLLFLKKFFTVICVIAILTTCITVSTKYIVKQKMSEIIDILNANDDNEIDASTVSKIKRLLKYSKEIDTFEEYYLSAVVSEYNSNYVDAIANYENSIALAEEDTSKANAYRKIGILYSESGEYQKAIQYLDNALALNSKDKNALLYKAECHIQTLDYASAVGIIDEYKLNYELTDAQYETVITMLVTTEEYSKAVGAATEAIQKYPSLESSFLTYRLQANILDNNLESAKEDAAKYIELTKAEVEPDILIASYAYALEKYETALEIYLDCIYNREMLTLYNQAIECAYQVDDYEAMLMLAEDALAYYEGDEQIEYYKWQAIALMQQNEFKKAIESFDIYLEKNTDHYEVIYLKGLCYFALGKYKEAIVDFTSTYDGGLLTEDSLYNRALCYIQMNDLDNALVDLEAIINLNSGSETYLSAYELYSLLKVTEEQETQTKKEA